MVSGVLGFFFGFVTAGHMFGKVTAKVRTVSRWRGMRGSKSEVKFRGADACLVEVFGTSN